MRGQNQSETFVLKHRLTGAAVLIGFAVVVLPMLLGGPDEASQNPPERDLSRAADEQDNVFRSKITPIGGDTPAVQAVSEPDGEPNDTRPAEDPDEPLDDSDTATAAGDDTAADDAPATESAPVIDRGWIVQVGTFKNSDNVEKLVAKLQGDGFRASTTDVETSAGWATRVWVGPFETRVEAARNKTRVKQRTGSEGLIVAYP